jgi:biotin carboxylase
MAGIAAARSAGIRVLAVDGDRGAPGLDAADAALVVDVTDPHAVVDAVRSHGVQPHGAVSFVADAGMAAVGALCEAFDLAGNDRTLARRMTDKSEQRAIWSQAGVPCPRWHVAGDLAEARHAVQAIGGGDLIVKPVDSAGSRGISRLTSTDDLEIAVAQALACSRSRRLLVEEFVVGTEYAVETFGDGARTTVLAVSRKIKVPGYDGTVASELVSVQDETSDHVAQLAIRAVDALGWRSGPGHVEILRDDATGACVLVEAAGRGGGFMVAEGFVPAVSGFDLLGATARQAVGMSPGPIAPERHAAVLRFFPSRPGTVSCIEGFEAAARISGVLALPLVEPGDVVGTPTSDAARLGFILASGATAAEAMMRADEAERLIRFEVVP